MNKSINSIFANCRKSGNCKLWMYRVSPSGYPVAIFGKCQRSVGSVVYELTRNVELRPRAKVRHSCGNKRCMNPEHLVVRTEDVQS